MDALRRSISIHRLRNSKADNQADAKDSNTQSASDPRSSIDTFIIPRRTRLPSDATRKLDTFDINVARKLLSLDGTASENKDLPRSASQYFDSTHDPKSGPLHRTATSANLRRDATSSDALSSRTPSGPPSYARGALVSRKSYDTSESNRYAREYSRLAGRYGLEILPVFSHEGMQSEEYGQQSQRNQTRIWLKRKLVRSGSPENGQRSTNLSRKTSMSSLFGRHQKMEMKQRSLDEICRLGGVSLLHMPSSYSAVGLYIPTCLAATGKFLLEHGRRTPGIFRIPGQASIVYLLHEHFLSQLELAAKTGNIQSTVCAPVLPVSLKFTVQDIASTFKKLLSNLPGGILGSIDLFKVLQELELKSFTQVSKACSPRILKSHLIALAILSQSERRVALISAVIGLLALLKSDEDTESTATWTLPTPRLMGPESMNSEALGVVYAPLLVGDLLASIEVSHLDDDVSYFSDSSPPKRAWLFKTPKASAHPGKRSEIAKSLERTRIASNIIEMLIQNWTEIIRRMKILQATSSPTGVLQCSANIDIQQISPWLGRESAINTYRRPFDEPPSLQYTKPRCSPISGLGQVLAVPTRSSSKLSYRRPSNVNFDPNSLSRSVSLSVLTQNFPIIEQIHAPEPCNTNVSNIQARSVGKSDVPNLWNAVKRKGERYPMDVSTATGDAAWWELNPHKTIPKTNVERRTQEGQLEHDKENFRLASSDTTLITPRRGKTVPESAVVDHAQSILADVQKDHMPSIRSDNHNETSVCKSAAQSDTTQENSVAPVPQNSSEGDSNPFDSRKSSVVSSFDSSSSSSSSENPSMAIREDSNMLKNGFHGIIIAPNRALDETSPYKTTASIASGQESGPLATQSTVIRLNQRSAEASPSISIKHSPSRIPRPVNDLGVSEKPHTSITKINRRTSVADIVAPLREASIRENRTSPNMRTNASPLSIKSNPNSNRSPLDEKTPLASQALKISRISGAIRGGHLPAGSEPPVARHLKFKRTGDFSISSESSNDPFIVHTTPNAKIGTLFSENRRLKSDLDMRNEEVVQLKNQLDAMRNLNDCGTLSERLRIAERDLKAWKRRAEWAERHLLGNGLQRADRI